MRIRQFYNRALDRVLYHYLRLRARLPRRRWFQPVKAQGQVEWGLVILIAVAAAVLLMAFFPDAIRQFFEKVKSRFMGV